MSGLLAPHDEALAAALAAAEAAGLPAIQVTPPQGKLLYLLAKSDRRPAGARVRHPRRLQHDLAGAGPAGGRAPDHPRGRSGARRGGARQHRAGRASRRWSTCASGPALESLPTLEDEDGPSTSSSSTPTRSNTPAYFDWSLERTRPGGLIVADNVDPRRRPRRRGRRGPGDRGPAAPARDARRRAAGRGDDDPDRGRQGLRRLHPGAASSSSSAEFAVSSHS